MAHDVLFTVKCVLNVPEQRMCIIMIFWERAKVVVAKKDGESVNEQCS